LAGWFFSAAAAIRGVTREMPPAVIAAAPPAAAKLDLKNDRRSRSSVSLNLRWCNSNSGQFLSSPAHIVSLLVSTWILGARLIPSQIIVTVKLVRYVTVDCWTAKCSVAAQWSEEKIDFCLLLEPCVLKL